MKDLDHSEKKRESRKKDRLTSAGPAIPSSERAMIREKREGEKRAHLVTSKKEGEKKGEDRFFLARFIGTAGQFLREARLELKKVKWPTRKELLASTAVVIGLVVVVSFLLGLIDYGLTKIIGAVIR